MLSVCHGRNVHDERSYGQLSIKMNNKNCEHSRPLCPSPETFNCFAVLLFLYCSNVSHDAGIRAAISFSLVPFQNLWIYIRYDVHPSNASFFFASAKMVNAFAIVFYFNLVGIRYLWWHSEPHMVLCYSDRPPHSSICIVRWRLRFGR